MKTNTFFTAILLLFILLSRSNNTGERGLNNQASLPDALVNKVSDLKVINSSINIKKHTTSLLYGNQKTIERLKGNDILPQKGEVIIWITWMQKPDPNWFGAFIPGKLLSFEVLEFKEKLQYQKFEGKEMLAQKDTSGISHRIKVLLQQKRAVLP